MADNFETKGVQSVYSNHALVSLSYNDVRVYLGELSPSELILQPTQANYAEITPRYDPKFCLVLSPEFARQLANAISSSVDKYESVFGNLRTEPNQEQITKATQQP